MIERAPLDLASAHVPDEVVDEHGRVLRLGERIGGGGQGVVYRVLDQPLAVKLIDDKDERDPHVRAAREILRRRLRAVALLPLRDLPAEEMPVAQPVALLRGRHVGYVMQYVDGVMELAKTCRPPRGQNLKDWYLASGGLRWRLRVLARLAAVLERLHTMAIVYGDLSPSNTLVSVDREYHEVWLIDPDNLRFSRPSAGGAVCTPPYAAPELKAGGHDSDSLTDAHSLAVIALELLTVAHPLLDGEVVYEDVERKQDALSGALPWIDHPERRENKRIEGVPQEKVLTRRLFALARRAFEQGLRDPLLRPTAGEWARELAWAAEMCIVCPTCRHTYLVMQRRCSWCEHPRPRFVLARIGLCDEAGNELPPGPRAPRLAIVADEEGTITRRLAFGESSYGAERQPVARVRLQDERVLWRAELGGSAIGEGPEVASLAAGETVAIRMLENQVTLTPGARAAAQGRILAPRIHFGPAGESHRVASLQVFEEVRS
jgi:serine/threonine protein kinase